MWRRSDGSRIQVHHQEQRRWHWSKLPLPGSCELSTIPTKKIVRVFLTSMLMCRMRSVASPRPMLELPCLATGTSRARASLTFRLPWQQLDPFLLLLMLHISVSRYLYLDTIAKLRYNNRDHKFSCLPTYSSTLLESTTPGSALKTS